MQVFIVVYYLLLVSIFVMLFATRKLFVAEDRPISVPAIVAVTLTGLLFFALYGSAIWSDYQHALHPDYKLAQTSEQAGFTVYAPARFIKGQEQITTYFIISSEFAGKKNAVRASYATPYRDMRKGTGDHLIVVTEVQVDPGFKVKDYIESQINTTKDTHINNVTLPQWPAAPAFSTKTAAVSYVFVLTPDNIFIQLASLQENEGSLLSVAGTLAPAK